MVEIISPLLTGSAIIILLYATLCTIHVIISLYSIYKGRDELSSGRIKRFMDVLLITISLGFVYIIWNLFINLNLVAVNQTLYNILFSNLLIIALVMCMTYLAFLAKDLGEEFGFRSVGRKITKLVTKKKKKLKY